MLMVEVCNRKALGFDRQFTTKAINCFKSGFLSLSPTDILYWKFFVMEAVLRIVATCSQGGQPKMSLNIEEPYHLWLRTAGLNRKEMKHLRKSMLS